MTSVRENTRLQAKVAELETRLTSLATRLPGCAGGLTAAERVQRDQSEQLGQALDDKEQTEGRLDRVLDEMQARDAEKVKEALAEG